MAEGRVGELWSSSFRELELLASFTLVIVPTRKPYER
jgi:hypothetical protein